MAMRPVVPYGDPVLRRQAAKVESIDDSILKLIEDMTETMHAANGVGLAAPQIGVSLQVMVIDWAAIDEENGHLQVYINPEIAKFGKKTSTHEEGCLSFPGTGGDVNRPDGIEIHYQDIDGSEQDEEYSEFPAHIVQHEYDHLMGVLFIDRITPDVRAKIKDDLQAILSGSVKPFDGVHPVETKRSKRKAVA